MMRFNGFHSIWFAVSGLTALGCGSADDARNVYDEALGSASSAIINGTAATVDNIGTPSIHTPYIVNCSGTMLTPTWMLTAEHCVWAGDNDSAPTVTPSLLTATIYGGSSQIATQIFRHRRSMSLSCASLFR
jgi:hypothetical protein